MWVTRHGWRTQRRPCRWCPWPCSRRRYRSQGWGRHPPPGRAPCTPLSPASPTAAAGPRPAAAAPLPPTLGCSRGPRRQALLSPAIPLWCRVRAHAHRWSFCSGFHSPVRWASTRRASQINLCTRCNRDHMRDHETMMFTFVCLWQPLLVLELLSAFLCVFVVYLRVMRGLRSSACL